MKDLLPAISLPTLTFLNKTQPKQSFRVGDRIWFRIGHSLRVNWYKETIVGVKRYKLLGKYGIRYKITYTARTSPIISQQRLMKLQEEYNKIHGAPEAEVIKPKRRWLSSVEGQW